MALVVEDDTGLSNAASYVSVVDYRAYCLGMGYDVTGDSDTECEIALRKGFQFVNSEWTYKGEVLVGSQAGEFPRRDLNDGSGRTFNTVPKPVKDAQCEAAFVARTEDLFQNQDRGGQIISETVGPISTTYSEGAPVQKLFTAVERLLKRFTRCADKPRRPSPFMGTPADPCHVFSLGMNDTPGAG